MFLAIAFAVTLVGLALIAYWYDRASERLYAEHAEKTKAIYAKHR